MIRAYCYLGYGKIYKANKVSVIFGAAVGERISNLIHLMIFVTRNLF